MVTARKQILQNHKRRGKTFAPPFTYMLGPLQEISWVKTILPELLWIALIQDYDGHPEGVALITSMARSARNCAPSGKRCIFATVSSYGELKTDEQSNLQEELEGSGELSQIQKALLPLSAFYPDCPLQFLFSSKPNQSECSQQDLKHLKTLVEGLYDKTSTDTMMVQVTMIWLAFDSGMLKVHIKCQDQSWDETDKAR